MIEVYTDGGVRPTNPGHASWAYVATRQGKWLADDSAALGWGTNNEAELTAAIMALYRLERMTDEVRVVSDSAYVVNGASSYLRSWVARDWQTSAGKPVANLKLWLELNELLQVYGDRLTWRHIRGHQGDHWNEYVDELCGNRIIEAIAASVTD